MLVKLELLLVFGAPLLDQSDVAPLRVALDKIKKKILFASHENEIQSLFDVVLPMSLIAEKGGSLTNVDGLVQAFSPALEAPGDCQPEWKFLVELAKELKINYNFYSQFLSLESIRKEMRKGISFFGKNSE